MCVDGACCAFITLRACAPSLCGRGPQIWLMGIVMTSTFLIYVTLLYELPYHLAQIAPPPPQKKPLKSYPSKNPAILL